MKKIFTPLFISLFSLTCFSFQTEAQILKKLGDKIGRSLEKSSEAEADAETEADADASKIRKRLPADFELELTGSGPDMYMEYQVIMEGEGLEDNQMGMSMKMFTSPSQRAGRAETIMTMPMIGEIRMVTLTDFDNPLEMIMLNERKKEYSVIDLNDINKRDDGEEYTVTRLGEENLHGMHCVRSKAVNEDGHTMEIWTTTEIPGYEDIAALYSKMQKMGSDYLWDELQQADAAGFMVKLEVQAEGGTSVMELVKIENTTVPESQLVVPTGYEKKEGGWANSYLKGL